MRRLLFLGTLLACAGCTAQDRADFKANFHPELIGSMWTHPAGGSGPASDTSTLEDKLDDIDWDLRRLEDQQSFDEEMSSYSH
jgi:hypothetical protein